MATSKGQMDGVQQAAGTAEVRRKLADLGGDAITGETPAAFATLITEATARGLSILGRAGVQPE
jgi:hypothetical protein